MEPQNQTPVAQLPASNSYNRQFIVLGLIITILLVFIIGGGILLLQKSDNEKASNNNSETAQNNNNGSSNTKDDSKADFPLIKDIGIDFDYYDEATGKAGDIEFTNKTLGEYNLPYFDYGFQVEASSAAEARLNPQPTFIVPLGTKVHSLIDGVVVNVPELYSGDYSIHVASSQDSQYIFETEHVINPLVKVGDSVVAGQEIAEVSDYDAKNYSGYGLYEIGILKGGNPPSHVCPFNYLDPSIKDDIHAKLLDFYKSWNTFKGEKVYNENPTVPGCLTLEEVPG